MEEEKSRFQRIEEKLDKLTEGKEPKEKKFRLPFKAKVSVRALKKGYVTIEKIGENKEIEFTKVPIIDGTIKLGDTIHSVAEKSIFTYKGKPFLHQAKNKLNPWSFDEKNETYGQKYVMARMKSDIISEKKRMGWGVSIFVLVIIGIIAYSFLTGG